MGDLASAGLFFQLMLELSFTVDSGIDLTYGFDVAVSSVKVLFVSSMLIFP